MWVWIWVSSTTPAGRQAEGVHRPAQVGVGVAMAERQPLADGCSSTWIMPNPGGLQIAHLVAQREGNLHAGLGARLIVAHERPLEDGDRSGEHAFHRLLGQ